MAEKMMIMARTKTAQNDQRSFGLPLALSGALLLATAGLISRDLLLLISP